MRRTVITKRFYVIPEDATPQTRWILNLLNEYNLTMAELADTIHVSRQTLSLWTNGGAISFGNICAICCMVDKNSDPERLYKLFNEGGIYAEHDFEGTDRSN